MTRGQQVGLIGLTKTWSMELGAFGIRVNAILPGAVQGERIERVFESRARLNGQTVDEVKRAAMAGKSIPGQMLPIDNGMQGAWQSGGSGRYALRGSSTHGAGSSESSMRIA